MSKTRQSKRLSTSTPKAKRTLLSTPTKETRAPKIAVKPAGRSLRTPSKTRSRPDNDDESCVEDDSSESGCDNNTMTIGK